jgi:hypothetical protein
MDMGTLLAAFGIVIAGIGVGAVARYFGRGRAPEVFLSGTMLGLAGALSATLIGAALDWYFGGLTGVLAGAAGAAILVGSYHAIDEVGRLWGQQGKRQSL